jgi:hypothetical protein
MVGEDGMVTVVGATGVAVTTALAGPSPMLLIAVTTKAY